MSWSTGYARGKKNIERYALPIVIVAGKTLRVKCEFIDKKKGPQNELHDSSKSVLGWHQTTT